MNLIGKEINNCYKITEKIDENNLFTIWKAEGLFSPLIFTLKFLNKEEKEYVREEYLRFEKTILSIYKINHPNLKRIYEIEKYENHTYVAMEYVEGESLYSYLNREKKLNYKTAFWIINEICKGLEATNRYGVFHKSLNPHHILLGIEKGEVKSVKISNFGFSEFEFFKRSSKGELIKRFGYLSPECFGYFTCSMDERSDLYSLGVIFYQLLTGKIFVKGNDIDEIFRDVLSKKSIELPEDIKSEMPPAAVKILNKLLNRRIEERYQSTIGLLTDFDRLNQGEKDFELGIEDKTFNPTFDTCLIDRNNELSVLKNMYDELSNKKGKFCLVEGDFGIGKSKLIEEFGVYVYKNNGIILNGNFKSSSNKIPFQGFREIIKDFLGYCKKLGKARKNKIDDMLLDLINKNKIVNKQFKPIINITKKNDRKIKDDDKKTGGDYIEKLSDFFVNLPDDNKFIVICLDNLQFADDDSLYLLNDLMNKIEKSNLFIIANYVKLKEDIHPLLNNILNYKNINKIHLNNFDSANTNNLLLNILNDKSLKVSEKIIDFIYKRSNGNPFYVKEAIRYLINEEVIYPVIDRWECDTNRLEKVNDFNAKDIILKRLQLLRSDELNILTIISIFDVEIELEKLEKTSGYSAETVLSIIDDLATQKLLFKKYTLEGTKVFMYEIVKSVLLNKLYEGKVKNMNFDIALKIEENFIENDVDLIDMLDDTFIVADSFIKSEDMDKSIEYSIKSGMVAKDIFAYNESIKYFNKAKNMLEMIKTEDDWQFQFVDENINEIKEILIDKL